LSLHIKLASYTQHPRTRQVVVVHKLSFPSKLILYTLVVYTPRVNNEFSSNEVQ